MSFFAQNSFVRKEDKENSKAASPRRARERSAPPKERSRSMKAEKVEKIEATEKTKKSVRLWNLSGRTERPDSWICDLCKEIKKLQFEKHKKTMYIYAYIPPMLTCVVLPCT